LIDEKNWGNTLPLIFLADLKKIWHYNNRKIFHSNIALGLNFIVKTNFWPPFLQ
jgi:hypothetical protein